MSSKEEEGDHVVEDRLVASGPSGDAGRHRPHDHWPGAILPRPRSVRPRKPPRSDPVASGR